MAVDQWSRNREHRCDRRGKQSRTKALCETGNSLHNLGCQHCFPLRQKIQDSDRIALFLVSARIFGFRQSCIGRGTTSFFALRASVPSIVFGNRPIALSLVIPSAPHSTAILSKSRPALSWMAWTTSGPVLEFDVGEDAGACAKATPQATTPARTRPPVTKRAGFIGAISLVMPAILPMPVVVFA